MTLESQDEIHALAASHYEPMLYSMEGSRRGDRSITLIGRRKVANQSVDGGAKVWAHAG